jgi:ubiquinone biosynthesis protein
MNYSKILKLPQYFRNIQRLREIAAVLVRHGFGDLVRRIQLSKYVSKRIVTEDVNTDEQTKIDFSTRIRLVLEELGPTFIKFGQLIATRPDIFPDTLIFELRKLQDNVQPFDTETAKKIIADELKKDTSAVFLHFEDLPLAAASIAQVHRATLLNGRNVAVKIQRPNLDRILDTDTDILRGLAALVEEHIPESSQFNPSKLVEEFSRSLKKERDFLKEAKSMERFARIFSDVDDLIIPEVIKEYSTARVLTQEYIEGIRADLCIEQKRSPYFETNKDSIYTSYDYCDRKKFNGRKIVTTLNNVVLKSIFEIGFFHADPHPGNVLITPNSTVALIDFGSMGRLDPKRRLQVLEFLLALLSKDIEKLLLILQEHQITPKINDPTPLKNQIADILDTYLESNLGELNFSMILSEVFEIIRTNGMKPPPDLLLVAKAITALQYIGASLDPEFNPIKAIRPYLIKRYAAIIANPKVYAQYAMNIADGYKKLLEQFPGDVRTILRQFARGEFVVGHKLEDFELMYRHQNKIVNRAIMTVIGVTFMVLSIFIYDINRISSGLGIVLFSVGVVVLVRVWYAVFKSGGI